MFISHAHHYAGNTADGRRIAAKPAAMTAPDGSHVPAIAVFSGTNLKFVVPTADALRIADSIVDAAEHHDAA